MSALNFDRILAIGAAILSIGAVVYSGLDQNNNFQFTTKADFTQFQLKNIEESTKLKSSVEAGFEKMSTQMANLQFVSFKEFLDFKDKNVKEGYDIRVEIETLKRELVRLSKTNEDNSAKAAALEAKINMLSEQLSKAQREIYSSK